ncbi:PKD domain-containing protein [Flavobacterium sp. RHBU_24]|uniref:PKD domain-containing protein n=1 Tax=Flavobacterium sp. RHBU_24 TaxID=3391185 RepID=UPI0039850817
MKKKYSLLHIILALLFYFSGNAQDWQWAKRGGGTDNIPEYTDNFREQVRDLDTDVSGNVFVLSPIGLTNVNVDGVDKETYGEYTGSGGALNDYMVSSFDCQGELRWAKVLGGFNSDYFHNIRTDASGSVYVAGQMYPASGTNQGKIHFDNDSIVAYQSGNVNKQSLFLIKYSNDGNPQWVRTPQPDNVSFETTVTSTFTYAMDVDAQGNSYWLCGLPQGTYAQGQYVNSQEGISTHLFKYDTNGNFIEGYPFDIELSGGAHRRLKMVRNAATGKFYIAGYRYPITTMEVSMGGEPVTKPMYLGAFSSTGTFEWKIENTENTDGPYYGNLCAVDLDAEGNIYITGRTKAQDTFAGATFESGTIYAFPFVVKISPDGTALWSTNAVTASTVYGAAIAVNGNEVAITGGGGALEWQGQSTTFVPNQGYDVFFARFSTADGTLVALNQVLGSTGYNDYGTALAASPSGDYYVGGSFEGQINPGETTLVNSGSQSDFFVAKFGDESCDCAAPVPAFSYVPVDSGLGFAFTYTGEAYDTITWSFGDEAFSGEVNPVHAYTASGQYNVCVTVTNACGSNQYCGTVNAVLDTAFQQLAGVSVFPNPVKSQLNINAPETVNYSLYSILGVSLEAGTLAPGAVSLNFENLTSGSYFLRLSTVNGECKTFRIIKE